MRQLFTCILIFTCTQLVFGQTADRIVIKDGSTSYLNTYQYEYIIVRKNSKYVLYQTKSYEREKGKERVSNKKKRIKSIQGKTVKNLLESLKSQQFPHLGIENFGIDQNWIDSTKVSSFKSLKDKTEHWADSQKEFTMNKLSEIENYRQAIKRTIGREGYYILSKSGGTHFSISVYEKGNKILEASADEKPFGMPWVVNEEKSYNAKIPRLLSKIIPSNKSFNKKRFDALDGLPNALASQIYDDQCASEMKRLAALEFEEELNELTGTFDILNAEEYRYRGRYVWDTPQVFIVTLQNEEMPKNILLQYFVTRQGKTIYSRDSLLNDYSDLLNRVQSVDFLMDYIEEDTSRTMEVFYFDYQGVNDHVIDGFNKNPEEWAQYDKYNKDSKFEHLYCGCNYRLDNEYLQSSILFELTDEFGNSSLWILLPDNTPVLHFFEGRRAYNYTYEDYGTKGVSVQYACAKFDTNGNLIKE